MLFGDDEDDREDGASGSDGAGNAEAGHDGGGLPEPRRARLCLGHEAVETDLLQRFGSGRFPHALIFSGIEGIGKATMAFRLARFFLKGPSLSQGLFEEAVGLSSTLEVPPDDPVFSRVASGGHPDLLTLERQIDEKTDRRKAILDVEQIRKVAPFLRMTASGGGWRVVVLDDADAMNRNAQNALLKILEEPPARTLLILIAHRAGSLLPTVRSRAQSVPFQPLQDAIVTRLLKQARPELGVEDCALLSELSEGSIGTALRLAEEGGASLIRQICAPLSPREKDYGIMVHRLAARLSAKDQEMAWRLFAGILPRLARRAVHARVCNPGVPVAAFETLGLAGWCQARSEKELLEISDGLQHYLERALTANLDRATAVLGAFGMMKGKERAV